MEKLNFLCLNILSSGNTLTETIITNNNSKNNTANNLNKSASVSTNDTNNNNDDDNLNINSNKSNIYFYFLEIINKITKMLNSYNCQTNKKEEKEKEDKEDKDYSYYNVGLQNISLFNFIDKQQQEQQIKQPLTILKKEPEENRNANKLQDSSSNNKLINQLSYLSTISNTSNNYNNLKSNNLPLNLNNNNSSALFNLPINNKDTKEISGSSNNSISNNKKEETKTINMSSVLNNNLINNKQDNNLKLNNNNSNSSLINKKQDNGNNKNSNDNSNSNLSNNDSAKVDATDDVSIKLLNSANNFWNIRQKLNGISSNKNEETILKKIMDEINPAITQLTCEDDLQRCVNKIEKVLKELQNNKKYDLFMFTIDDICKRLIYKSERYKNEPKKNFFVFSKLIFLLNEKLNSNSNNSSNENKNVLSDYFIGILCYKCPYVIPKVFTEQDFNKDKKVLMKRKGYSDENEKYSEFISNMESYSYLYFSFLFLYDNNTSKIKIIKSYLNNLESLPKITEELGPSFKAFLNCLGNYSKDKLQLQDKIKALSIKVTKDLDSIKTTNKQLSVDVKSVISDNIHFIKSYLKQILEGKKTDMHA